MLGLGQGRVAVLVRGNSMYQDVTKRTVMKEYRKTSVDIEISRSSSDKDKEVGSGGTCECVKANGHLFSKDCHS